MEQYKCKKGNGNGKRFLLQKEGKKTMLFIGGSPSDGDWLYLDPTSRNIEKLAKQNGCDGWAIINLSTQEIDCYDNISLSVSDNDINENIDFIKEFLLNTKLEKFVVGWGDIVNELPYLKDCSLKILDLLKLEKIECIELTKKGNPYSAAPMAVNRNLGGISNVELKPFNKPLKKEYDLTDDLDTILKTVKNILDNYKK